jgi:hypothetical protein
MVWLDEKEIPKQTRSYHDVLGCWSFDVFLWSVLPITFIEHWTQLLQPCNTTMQPNKA